MPNGVEQGRLYRKTGGSSRLWRVEDILERQEGAHVRLRAMDDPTTMITVALAALTDRRLFEAADGRK